MCQGCLFSLSIPVHPPLLPSPYLVVAKYGINSGNGCCSRTRAGLYQSLANGMSTTPPLQKASPWSSTKRGTRRRLGATPPGLSPLQRKIDPINKEDPILLSLLWVCSTFCPSSPVYHPAGVFSCREGPAYSSCLNMLTELGCSLSAFGAVPSFSNLDLLRLVHRKSGSAAYRRALHSPDGEGSAPPHVLLFNWTSFGWISMKNQRPFVSRAGADGSSGKISLVVVLWWCGKQVWGGLQSIEQEYLFVMYILILEDCDWDPMVISP